VLAVPPLPSSAVKVIALGIEDMSPAAGFQLRVLPSKDIEERSAVAVETVTVSPSGSLAGISRAKASPTTPMAVEGELKIGSLLTSIETSLSEAPPLSSVALKLSR